MMKRPHLLSVLAAVLVAGCHSEPPEDPGPPKIPFEGEVDKRLVGKWKADLSNSLYTFGPDGTYELKAKVRTPGGEMNTESKGEWKVKGDEVLFRDTGGNVVRYALAYKESQMTLALTGTMKRETKLNRLSN